jgi:hypothetical protein
MDSAALFGLSVLMSFVAFGTVTKLYILPRLRAVRREDALIPLLIPHTFRFVGCALGTCTRIPRARAGGKRPWRQN